MGISLGMWLDRTITIGERSVIEAEEELERRRETLNNFISIRKIYVKSLNEIEPRTNKGSLD